MNEWKPSYLGVAVVPRTRPMAPELRGSCLARRQGSSSDLRSVREKAQIAPVRKGSTSAFNLATKVRFKRDKTFRRVVF